jgi:hypothetical protein
LPRSSCACLTSANDTRSRRSINAFRAPNVVCWPCSPWGFLHPPDLQPDLVARFCQLPLVACHESSRGKHRDRVARSGDLAVLALAPRSWEELVAVIRNQCSANPHYPWRVSHDPSPDVCPSGKRQSQAELLGFDSAYLRPCGKWPTCQASVQSCFRRE